MEKIKDFTLKEQFLLAKAFMEKEHIETNDIKMSKKYGLKNLLDLYGYVQIIEVGVNRTKEPPLVDRKHYLQWKAWLNMCHMTKEECMEKYIEFVSDKM